MADKDLQTKSQKSVIKEEKVSAFSISSIKKFVGEVQAEYNKIVWPNKKMTLGLAGIVIVMTVIVSIYLGSVDMLLGALVSRIL